MPSTMSILPSTSHSTLQFPWKPRNSYCLKFKTLSLSITSHGSGPQLPFIEEIKTFSKIHLPVVIKRNGKDYRYFYDGYSLELVCIDCGDAPTSLYDGFENGYKKFVGIVRDFFIPEQVTHNYVDYVKWKFLHRVFSSALQVLATQAMFRAIGVGSARSLPSAAALNWVLKDGLGRLSRCIYTACVGSAFDTSLKTAVHRSFALADNMGEVSAKAQIQTVCFDNLGLLLAASLNLICRSNQSLLAGLPFVVYPIFSAIDLCGIYQSLKHVHLQTLNKVRLEIILDTWIHCGYVPSPAEVSQVEGINLFEDTGRKEKMCPIRIGCLDPERQIPVLGILTMKNLSMEDLYFISLETRGGLRRTRQLGILLALKEGAGTQDIITGLLQACYIQEAIISSGKMWEKIVETFDASDSIASEWFSLIHDSKHRAQSDQKVLLEMIMTSGWAAKNVLLNPQEQSRYNFTGENI